MLIQAKNIGHSYEHKLFENISLEVKSGDFIAIYWPSGVGKTTFLQILGRLLKPKTGSMEFHTFLTDRQKSFWYAFVGWPFFEEMSVKENILFLKNFSKIEPNIEKYEKMMNFFELKKLENRPIKSLSIGQRERANIIRAFVHEPKIIIMDEPGSNLDDKNFIKLFDFLEEEKKSWKTAIIIATHDERYKKIATQTQTFELIEND